MSTQLRARLIVLLLITFAVLLVWRMGGDPVNNESGNNGPPDTYTTTTYLGSN